MIFLFFFISYFFFLECLFLVIFILNDSFFLFFIDLISFYYRNEILKRVKIECLSILMRILMRIIVLNIVECLCM